METGELGPKNIDTKQNYHFGDEILADPNLRLQLEATEKYKVQNMRDFFDEQYDEPLRQDISAAGGKFIIAVHPYHLVEYKEEADDAIRRAISIKSPAIPPLAVMEGISYVWVTDKYIGQLLTPDSRPVYLINSFDRRGEPLPPGVTPRDLLSAGIYSVTERKIRGEKKTFNMLEFVRKEGANFDQQYARKLNGLINLFLRLRSLGAKTAILAGSNMELEARDDWREAEDLSNTTDRGYLAMRESLGAKRKVIPTECVGQMYSTLSRLMPVELSNFVRRNNRSDLEKLESTEPEH